MSTECKTIHKLIRKLKKHKFPFEKSTIPSNGIYILFQKKEKGHQGERIVRVGTHTGDNQLQSRLKQHFLNQNKDRSIFRKNIGRALLSKNNDSFLQHWEIDLTSRKAKEKYLPLIDLNYQKTIENQVSDFIQTNFYFCVFEVPNKKQRLYLESRLISTISWCQKCKPSRVWLGNASPKNKIVESGLWLVNELYKIPFDTDGINKLSQLIK